MLAIADLFRPNTFEYNHSDKSQDYYFSQRKT